MPSFLDALRDAIPSGGNKATAASAKASPASPSLSPAVAAPPVPANATHQQQAVAELERLFPFHDPFLLHGGLAGEEGDIWGISNPRHERELLSVLCVDHADLQEANEREAAVGAVGAVVTKKTAKKGGAAGGGNAGRASSALEPAEKLLQTCAAHTSSSAGGFFTTMELAEMVLQTVLDHPQDADMVQTQLFGLVGVEGMDVIAFAIQNQQELAKHVKKQHLQDAQKQQELAEKFASTGGGVGGTARPTVASSFSIQTASEQLFLKQQRKANRKARAQNGGGHNDEDDEQNWLEAAGYDPEVLRLQREFAQEEMRNQSTSLLQREFGQLQGGYDTSGAAGQLTSAGLLTLPESTKRTYFKGYEHVYIPAHAKKSLAANETLVPISDLEAFAQTAFRGMTHLNRLQSKLFRSAYETNQNLLVCAPTGAGKTNVAMLTILQEVKSTMQRHGTLANMKIIYVAPMKALAQEVVTKFGERLASLKMKVAELTGDMQLTKKEIELTHVIVTTPEKWDVITRKSSTQQALLSQVKLLIIDEVHLLADERGPVIETIVARTVRRVESTQSMIRIVGLSATLPNYVDVASFLRVYVPPGDVRMQNAATNGGKGGLFFFDATYRPVPLDQTFIGISTNANLKEALGMSAAALSTTVATDEDAAKMEKQRMGAASNMSRQAQVKLMMNKLALAHCLKQVENGEQVMVFVHSRKETAATMRAIVELSQGDEEEPGTLEAFLPPSDLQMPMSLIDRVQRSRNKELKELLTYGLGIHHAGMLRSDRNLSEELFERGFIRTLCCTATLAWGVNLPAHSVLIKGTQVYNSDKGGMTNLSMLDVMQIFGRAGRPQYDTSGDAVLMTTQDQLPHYLRLLTTGIPMESALIKALPDHLNAEIVSGTVSNLDEACEWLSYTYLYVRMKKNPLAYGMKIEDVQQDPLLIERRKQLLMDAAEKLASCRMIKVLREKTRLDQPGEGKVAFAVTSMGRVASHFYIQHTSIETFNELLDGKAGGKGGAQDDDDMPWEKVLLVLCSSNEFEQMKSREDEMPELEKLAKKFCRFDVLGGGLESYQGKTNVLLQSLIGRARVSSFTLISDTNYVAQNASRVCRALFEICLKKNSARKAEKFLQLSNCIDQKIWWDQCLLLQLPNIPLDVVGQVESQHLDLYEALADPNKYALSAKVRKWVNGLPFIDVDEVQMQPFGGNMLKLSYSLLPLFPEWKDNTFGGKTMSAWVWVEDAISGYIYHSEYFVLHQSRFMGWKEGSQTLEMECYLPVFVSEAQKEATYVIRVLSDRFVGIESYYEVSYTPDNSQLAKAKKDKEEMYTNLLRLHPQPLSSLQNPVYEAIYASKFRFLNPIQTQTFHQLYHQDGNVLICAPTGSGKTMCAELAMMRVWNQNQAIKDDVSGSDGNGDENAGGRTRPNKRSLIVYIAPLKALAREKVAEWKARFEHNPQMRKKVVEVTGDTVVNVDYILHTANIVITTPEKWDLLTRNVGFGRKLMDKIALVVIDEVHLVGDAPRGAVLEVLISRLRRFSRSAKGGIRLLGLSTALANASDVGQWLGITRENKSQIYNFRASVRPVPMEVHIQGFPERHYVARMAAMNKPTFMAIKTHSPEKPVLIFVSSKAQTKMTALDLISFCVSHGNDEQSGQGGGAKRFLKMDEAVMDSILSDGHSVQDESLRHTLTFGIGLHHAGLPRKDRELVEKLFRDRLIQVIISTSTLAWGVNLPAHLVIIKGTEYFQNGRYQSYPLSDLLQMIGRAGRPLLDDKGVACVLVEESKKNMTQRFLYEPLAIESCLSTHLANHLNAEIASGLLKKKQDVLEYLSWSLLFQRVMKNPSFYGIGAEGKQDVEAFFEELVTTSLKNLEASQCITVNAKDASIQPTFLGKIAAALYVDVKTVARMLTSVKAIAALKKADKDGSAAFTRQIMSVICESSVEIRETIPLRHNEIQSSLITDLCAKVRHSPMTSLYRSTPKKQKTLLETHGSELKAFVLLQMHLMRMGMPSSDFGNDLRTLLDQLPRLLGAVIDICAFLKQSELVFAGVRLSQAIVQARWPVEGDIGGGSDGDVLAQLPHASAHVLKVLKDDLKLNSFAELQELLKVKQKKAQLVDLLTKSTGGGGRRGNKSNNSSGALSKNQSQDLVRVAEAIPRLQVAAAVKQRQQKSLVVSVELMALNENVSTLAYAKRFQKPKPYGFYVILAATKKPVATTAGATESEGVPDDKSKPETTTPRLEVLQMKHVASKQKAEVTFPLAAAPSGQEEQLVVLVMSDAIAGIDVSCPVEV
ncbi:Activating signal cointegrator 1 complex subunit 3 [Globisporangium polare]